ncbi:MAG: MFS transporter [Flavisolibacter sp.]
MYKKTPVFLAACFGMLLFGISLITLGSITPHLKTKFMLDDVAAGTLFAILPIGILAGSLLFGPVCDRYGYKLLLILACLGMFAGFEGIAYASSLGVLKLCIFIFGLGGGVVNGATNAVVADISDVNKGANLSLLGVFFGVGALGMPLVLALLSKTFQPFEVIAVVGWLTLIVSLVYLFIRFPSAKQQATIAAKWSSLLKPLLVLIAFFLFCQSSLEAIINNWTTTYLISRGAMSESNALYALSLHIVGMITMRLLTGSVFRSVSQVKMMWACLVLLFAGIFLMQLYGKGLIVAGLVLSGAGLAGGFPIMLGFVGERFATLSGTAFSFVFAVALIGNMLINYAMGFIVHHYGIQHLTTVCYVEIGIMVLLFLFIVQKFKSTYN